MNADRIKQYNRNPSARDHNGDQPRAVIPILKYSSFAHNFYLALKNVTITLPVSINEEVRGKRLVVNVAFNLTGNAVDMKFIE